MTRTHLEDAIQGWREKTQTGTEAIRDDLLAKLMNAWPAKGDEAPPASELDATARVVMRELVPAVADRFADEVLEYVEQTRKIEMPAPRDRVRDELAAAFDLITAPPELTFPPPILRTRAIMWAIPAAVGAALGVFLFPPLALVAWGSRDLGYVLGAPVGAALLTLLAALLSEHPRVRLAVQCALGVAVVAEVVDWVTGGISPLRRIWRFLGHGKPTLGRRLQRIGLWLAAIFTLHLTRARAVLRREDVRDLVEAQIEEALRGHCDLLLALAWTQADAAAGRAPGDAGMPLTSTAVLEALAKMRPLLEAEEAPPELIIAAREAIQALETSGIVIREYPDGTPFDAGMKEQFELRVPVAEGEPIRTLRPALVTGGQVVVRGYLDRSQRRSGT